MTVESDLRIVSNLIGALFPEFREYRTKVLTRNVILRGGNQDLKSSKRF